MSAESPFLNYHISARAFLNRASAHLSKYENEECVESFFYAALELRFGIEARLNDYLKAALQTIGKDSKDIKDYVASKLLKRLISIDPEADSFSRLRITCEESENSTTLCFTPVSQRLASIHGQLGEFLHYKFFNNNKHWFCKKPLGKISDKSISDYVPLIKEGLEELKVATSGSLLSNPRFTAIVADVANEIQSDKNG